MIRRREQISIHAPAKGATIKLFQKMGCWVFQSTLPRRERLVTSSLSPVCRHFNPRSREGSDSSRKGTGQGRQQISIHAPAKGATIVRLDCHGGAIFQSTLPRRERRHNGHTPGCHSNFNPRSREGSDNCTAHSSGAVQPFQSTLPRRERRRIFFENDVGLYFNPRSREGSDTSRAGALVRGYDISIHAPAKGATTTPARRT